MICLKLLEIKERYYLNFLWKLHKMILPKEVAEIRHRPSHYLEANRAVYDLFDVVRPMIFARCP